ADVGPADWLLAAQLLINKGAPAEARTFLDRILVDSRATPREQLQAAVLELASARSGSSTPNERETAAWSRLEKLSADQSAGGLAEWQRRISKNARYHSARKSAAIARPFFATSRCSRRARPLERSKAIAFERPVPTRTGGPANVSRPVQRAARRENGHPKLL